MGGRCYRRGPQAPRVDAQAPQAAGFGTRAARFHPGPQRREGTADNRRMHLLIPFASALSDAATQVVRDMPLPQLSKLLASMSPTANAPGDELSFSPPHERALAAAWQWRGADGCLPFAARAAALDGIDVGDAAWGLLTPAHWHVARDHVSLADPAALSLSVAESRTAFDAVRELFEDEGMRFEWGSALRWYASHEGLADLPCAALDRVIGRRVELWTGTKARTTPAAALMRRLQSEVQMLLYPHPINDEREARGELTLNSFWLSGCGRFQPADPAAVQIDDTLRAPMLAQDWAAWAEAWQALDAGAIKALLDVARRGEPATLTLCGERSARRFENVPRPWLQRLRRHWSTTQPHTVLEAL